MHEAVHMEAGDFHKYAEGFHIGNNPGQALPQELLHKAGLERPGHLSRDPVRPSLGFIALLGDLEKLRILE